MGDIPYTRNRTSPEREEAIRESIRRADHIPGSSASGRLATLDDAPEFLTLFEHPAINKWIYSIPRPLTLESVRAFIQDALDMQARGEVLLALNRGEHGEVTGYSEVRVWPEWAAGEVAGAISPDRQNKGQGAAGMVTMFTWMFETFDLDLICNTTALDNVRMQSLFRRMEFDHQCNMENLRPDGTVRESQVWEIPRERWFSMMAGRD